MQQIYVINGNNSIATKTTQPFINIQTLPFQPVQQGQYHLIPSIQAAIPSISIPIQQYQQYNQYQQFVTQQQNQVLLLQALTQNINGVNVNGNNAFNININYNNTNNDSGRRQQILSFDDLQKQLNQISYSVDVHVGVDTPDTHQSNYQSNHKSNRKSNNKAVDGKSYQCVYCNHTFKQSHSLKDHIRTHTGEKPYSCNYCTRRFKVKYNMVVHTRIHTGVKPYSCKICEKRYASKSGLNAHSKKHHPIYSQKK